MALNYYILWIPIISANHIFFNGAQWNTAVNCCKTFTKNKSLRGNSFPMAFLIYSTFKGNLYNTYIATISTKTSHVLISNASYRLLQQQSHCMHMGGDSSWLPRPISSSKRLHFSTALHASSTSMKLCNSFLIVLQIQLLSRASVAISYHQKHPPSTISSSAQLQFDTAFRNITHHILQ